MYTCLSNFTENLKDVLHMYMHQHKHFSVFLFDWIHSALFRDIDTIQELPDVFSLH